MFGGKYKFINMNNLENPIQSDHISFASSSHNTIYGSGLVPNGPDLTNPSIQNHPQKFG